MLKFYPVNTVNTEYSSGQVKGAFVSSVAMLPFWWLFFCFGLFVLFFVFDSRFYYVAEVSLELTILLPQPPKC